MDRRMATHGRQGNFSDRFLTFYIILNILPSFLQTSEVLLPETEYPNGWTMFPQCEMNYAFSNLTYIHSSVGSSRGILLDFIHTGSCYLDNVNGI